jgi:hypothetical protein
MSLNSQSPSAKIIPAIYNDLSQYDALSPPAHKYSEKLVAKSQNLYKKEYIITASILHHYIS